MHRLVAELHKAGFVDIREVVPDEKFHRFKDSPDDKKNSGYYIAFRNRTNKTNEDFFVMVYGTWHKDQSAVYNTLAGIKLDKFERQRVDEQIRLAKRKLELERLENQKSAAAMANQIWDSLQINGTDNAYLIHKGIDKLYGARIIDQETLAVPMRDASGDLKNIERIFGNGEIKKGLFGGQRKGLFHIIGELSDVVYIASGFSTSVAIHKAIGVGVVCSFNDGNIPVVAKEILQKYPNRKYVVCGDNDQFPNKLGEINNGGRDKAEEAALAIGGKFLIPIFSNLNDEPTDFDDLMHREGIETVKNQIMAINPQEVVTTFDQSYVVNAPYPDENPKTLAKKDTIENVAELIRRLRIVVRYNVISKEEEIIIPNCGFTIDNKANATLAHITSWCNRVGIPTQGLGGHLTALADENLYNPVATWIESNPWDGVSRLKEFFGTITSKNEPLKETLMRKWMISAIAAAFNPNGVSAHGVLVLQGNQYSGKTQWFKNLAPAHLGILKDGLTLDPRDKDSVFQIVRNWIVELGEIDSTFRKADIAQLKAFVTKGQDSLRRAYARKESDYARRTVFFASVNEKDFLKDPTGNRRFWTIECESINCNHNLDMQQIWAEVLTFYRAGDTWYLTQEELLRLNENNETFQEVNSIEERILTEFPWNQTFYENKRSMTATQVCEAIGIKNPSTSECRSAGRILRKLCGEPKKKNGSSTFEVPAQQVKSPYN